MWSICARTDAASAAGSSSGSTLPHQAKPEPPRARTPDELFGDAEDATLPAVGHERDRRRAPVHLGLEQVGVVERPAVPRG